MDKGSHFYCCDFQVHTPRDRQWRGNGAVTDQERKDYAQEFIAKCREIGLDAIGVTDHHDMTFVEYIREAAAAEKDANGNLVPMGKRIIVFPGMELTLGIPCQALVLFDADLTNDALNLAIARLGIVPAPAQESKSAAPTRLDDIKSFAQLYELLDRILRGHYIVIPNLSDGRPGTLLKI